MRILVSITILAVFLSVNAFAWDRYYYSGERIEYTSLTNDVGYIFTGFSHVLGKK